MCERVSLDPTASSVASYRMPLFSFIFPAGRTRPYHTLQGQVPLVGSLVQHHRVDVLGGRFLFFYNWCPWEFGRSSRRGDVRKRVRIQSGSKTSSAQFPSLGSSLWRHPLVLGETPDHEDRLASPWLSLRSFSYYKSNPCSQQEKQRTKEGHRKGSSYGDNAWHIQVPDICVHRPLTCSPGRQVLF